MVRLNGVCPNPVLHSGYGLSEGLSHRVCNVALPFLNLYPPTRRALTIGLGATHTLANLKGLYDGWSQASWRELGARASRLTIVITSTALTILRPAYVGALAQGYEILNSFYRAAAHGSASEWRELLVDVSKLTSHGVHLGAQIYGGTPLVALSYLALAAGYLVDSYSQWKEGHYLEAGAYATLGGIFGYQAAPYIQEMFSNKLSLRELGEFIDSLEAEYEQNKIEYRDFIPPADWSKYLLKDKRQFDLSAYLKDKGLPSTLSKYRMNDFSLPRKTSFKHITFDRCSFEGVCLRDCEFEGVTFKGCNMNDMSLSGSFINRSRFLKSSLNHSQFVRCIIADTDFSHCEMKSVYFLNNFLSYQVIFSRSNMEEATFLFNPVQEAKFANSKTVDLFSDTDIPGINTRTNKPLVGLSIEASYERGVYGQFLEEAIRQGGGRPVLFPYNSDAINVNEFLVKKEASRILNDFDSKNSLSRIEHLFTSYQKKGGIEKIDSFAERLIRLLDVVFIPGGCDVSRALYSDETAIEDSTTFARDLIESAVIRRAIEQEIPIAGVCRGAQLINVSRGGTLKDTDKGEGLQILKPAIEPMDQTGMIKSVFGRVLKDGHLGYSAHYQAVDRLAPGLVKVLEYQGCLKAFASKDQPIFGFQFHPEHARAIHSDGSGLIMTILHDLVSSRRGLSQSRARLNELRESASAKDLECLKEAYLAFSFDVAANLKLYQRVIDLARKKPFAH